ncbi:primosomal protein N' [bacterium]|jgi:primosomal protein N' (replication factor Y) (superfamily II helicase)|nr:primosomal protein N' [bacterium]
MSEKQFEVLVCRNVGKTYTYTQTEVEDDLQIGEQVVIPFGRGSAYGLIIAKREGELHPKTKSILSKRDKSLLLSQDIITLIKWFSETYQCTPHKAFQTVIGSKKYRLCEDIDDNEIELETPPKLTPSQVLAMEAFKKETDAPYLLHGITGSGKTELYMRLVADALNNGQGALVLIPEIALTPQMRNSFTQRFGNQCAVMHSGQTPKQKEVAWNRIAQGKAKIAIGPRSVIFSPMPNIGVIIIDEAHEPSYKQDNHPRYLTETVAQYRAQIHKAKLVLGTATPTIEQAYECANNTIVLKERVNERPLPPVTIVDMKEEVMDGHYHPISRPLLQAINATHEKGEKTLIFVNRRGFASSIRCQSCSAVHNCKECNLSFTYHRDQTFRCHRCDITTPITHKCQACGKNQLAFTGSGTQKIESELQKMLPELKIMRLDKDSTRTSNIMEKTLNEFRESGDILIGTQLIAKGHHFEAITLVGVIGIDTTLAIPDFRASERAFQLITQVAGRAGRGTKEGHVYVQTFQPKHYAIKHAMTHNFEGFYAQETQFREALRYPPYSQLINIIISSLDASKVHTHANQVSIYLNDRLKSLVKDEKVQIIGPKPAPIELLKNHTRWNCLLKCDETVLAEVKAFLPKLPVSHKDVKVIVDFDPRSIL